MKSKYLFLFIFCCLMGFAQEKPTEIKIDLEKRINKEMLSDEQQKLFDELLQSDTELNPVLIKYWFK